MNSSIHQSIPRLVLSGISIVDNDCMTFFSHFDAYYSSSFKPNFAVKEEELSLIYILCSSHKRHDQLPNSKTWYSDEDAWDEKSSSTS